MQNMSEMQKYLSQITSYVYHTFWIQSYFPQYGKWTAICGLKSNKWQEYTVSPRSSDPFYKVSYYIKWVATSCSYSIYNKAHDNKRL